MCVQEWVLLRVCCCAHAILPMCVCSTHSTHNMCVVHTLHVTCVCGVLCVCVPDLISEPDHHDKLRGNGAN